MHGKGSMLTTQQLSWKKGHYTLLALIILLTGAAQIYLFRQGFYSISSDENARTLMAAEMPFSQILLPVTSWLPLQILVNKLGLLLYYDLLLTPRILTSIVGIVASMALMFLAYRLFRNSTISIITGILAIYFPNRLVFSVAPMAEIYFMCFMTLGCAFVLGWFTDERKGDLFLSTICFLLCSALRYEGWLVCATMVCILTFQLFITRNLGWGTYLINIFILTSFPLYWLLSAYFTKYMWVFSFVSKYYIDVHGKDPMGVWERSFLYQVIVQSVYSPLIAGLISFICQLVQDKKVRLWSLLSIIPIVGMTILGFVTYSLALHNWWRLAGPVTFLLLPFLAHFIYTACSATVFNRPAHYILLAIVTLLFVAGFRAEASWRTKYSNMKSEQLMAGTFLKTLDLKDNDKILIDTCTRSYGPVIIASNMPDRFIKNEGSDPFYPQPAVLDLTKGIDVTLLKNTRIKYLVFQTNRGPDIGSRKLINKINAQASILNTSKDLQKINQIGEWGIFALR